MSFLRKHSRLLSANMREMVHRGGPDSQYPDMDPADPTSCSVIRCGSAALMPGSRSENRPHRTLTSWQWQSMYAAKAETCKGAKLEATLT
jgi:hypothetical protein